MKQKFVCFNGYWFAGIGTCMVVMVGEVCAFAVLINHYAVGVIVGNWFAGFVPSGKDGKQ